MERSKTKIKIKTEDGERILENIYFTDLDHLMIRTFDMETETYTNKRIGSLSELLSKNNIEIVQFINLKSEKIIYRKC